jgi:hypothetical protein
VVARHVLLQLQLRLARFSALLAPILGLLRVSEILSSESSVLSLSALSRF